MKVEVNNTTSTSSSDICVLPEIESVNWIVKLMNGYPDGYKYTEIVVLRVQAHSLYNRKVAPRCNRRLHLTVFCERCWWVEPRHGMYSSILHHVKMFNKFSPNSSLFLPSSLSLQAMMRRLPVCCVSVEVYSKKEIALTTVCRKGIQAFTLRSTA